ncbi:hypothetical protein ABH935_002922 [Catenulispora sp. GAS73]
MTKTAGVFLALIVVGIAVTTHTHASGPVCPATSGHAASSSSGGGSGR